MWLLLLLVLGPILELVSLVAVASWLGFLATLGLLALSALVGTGLIYWNRTENWPTLRAAWARGEPPGPLLLASLAIFLAGVLLIVPGFVSDVVALLLLVPWTREGLRWLASRWIQGQFTYETFVAGPDGVYYERTTTTDGPADTIDVTADAAPPDARSAADESPRSLPPPDANP